MAAITLNSVEKSYQADTYAVRDVNLDIKEGEFVVFVGPSGCGKSTLLRMIAGLETVTDGDIHINESRVNDVSPSDRDVAMVFQNYALYPHMTVYNNLAYGLKNRKFKKSEIEQRVQDAAKMLKIEDFLNRKPSQLSGGQRQRVAMGRALARHPQVFLFDEPLSNLDAKLRVEMRVEIKRLQKRLGVTSIYVTHDQTEAMTLADRLVVINNGRIEQTGSPMEIYKNPANEFVAGFIGTPHINIFNGNDIIPCLTGLNLTMPDNLNVEDIRVGIRPEKLKRSDAGSILFRPEVIEQHGADNILYGVLRSGKNESEIHNFCVGISNEFDIETGQEVRLSVSTSDVLLFDKTTGQIISK